MGVIFIKETLKLILGELKELKKGQEELKKDMSSIKENLINGLRPYFESIEKPIDVKAVELKDTLEDQQKVIDILSIRSVKHERELKERILTNQ